MLECLVLVCLILPQFMHQDINANVNLDPTFEILRALINVRMWYCVNMNRLKTNKKKTENYPLVLNLN